MSGSGLPPQILVYAAHDAQSVRDSLGAADYSYHFVLEAFLPMLETCGSVRRVRDPAREVPQRVAEAREAGRDSVFLSFAPPHATVILADCPVIPVFAWEFATLPDTPFSDDWRNDWVEVLRRCGQAITHSQFAAGLVRDRLGPDYPVAVIPAPVWERYSPLARPVERAGTDDPRTLELDCTVVDSAWLEIDPERVVPRSAEALAHADAAGRSWDGREIRCEFRFGGRGPLAVGFHAPEDWGMWSREETAWIVLPQPMCGDFRLRLRLAAHGANIGRSIALRLGAVTHRFEPQAEAMDYEFGFRLETPANLLVIEGMEPSRPDAQTDPRFLGVALLTLSVCVDETAVAGSAAWPAGSIVPLRLQAPVYTAIFNPKDGRKNWQDIVTAFCTAFRVQPSATLVLKMTHHDMSAYVEEVFLVLRQLAPFACRVVVMHGYLDDAAYASLVRRSDFIVSASCGEGQCLPLMEYMSAAVPAVATCNTAMQDYVTRDNAFVVGSSPEPTYWPHDPRQVLGTLRHRVSWESLHDALSASYALFQSGPEGYVRMGVAATSALHDFCSREVLEPRLRDFLARVRRGVVLPA